MKRYLFLLLFLSSIIATAQSFEFNYLTKYTTKHDGESDYEVVIYTNSKNDSYYFRILKDKNNHYFGYLYDLNKLYVHQYTIDLNKDQNDLTFEFNYKKSDKLTYDKNIFKNIYHQFKKIDSTEVSNQKIRLDVYKNKKNSKPIFYIDFEITESNENLFPAYRISCIHPYEFHRQLDFGKGIVKNAKGMNDKGKTFESKLIELKEVNFELNIPTDLNTNK